MSQVREPTPPHNNIKQEPGLDPQRGRRWSRSDTKGEDNEMDGIVSGDAEQTNENSSSDGNARKRRRSRKGLDKKFECPAEGCGKSYSRAEHLYRHQLNHDPKQLYRCDFGNCTRTFVRLDLRNRHRDRHTAKGSTLNRKDSMTANVSPSHTDIRPLFPQHAGSSSPEMNRPGSATTTAATQPATAFTPGRSVQMQYHASQNPPYTTIAGNPPPPSSFANGARRNGMDYMPHDAASYAPAAQILGPRPAQTSPITAQRPAQASFDTISPISAQHAFPGGQPTNAPPPPQQPSNHVSYMAQQPSYPPFSLPPSSDFAAIMATSGPPLDSQQVYAQSDYGDVSHQHHSSDPMMLLDQMGIQATIPVFGSESVLNKSPHAGLPEDFMAYLFNMNYQQPTADASALGGGAMSAQGCGNYGEFGPNNQYAMAYYGAELSQFGYFPNPGQQVMSVTNLVEQNLPESIISDAKAAEVFEFIKERFQDKDHAPVERRRDLFIQGDHTSDEHVLSRKRMQSYIGSYWVNFSEQIPILHKPSFSPDTTPILLLLAMMTIGAALIDRSKDSGHDGKSTTRVSDFLVWHLRWEMFQDANCRPPAKLWVFQTLLLLELYEKMYSTRELHERAHIHHATTITLMRRGRSLIGKSNVDSPPNPREDIHNNGSSSGTSSNSGNSANNKQVSSRQSSSSALAHTPDEWWSHWITNEATRRAAFVAFIMDSIHATMFGHSAAMTAHEMRLPLPADDRLWYASSGAEVGRIESNLLSTGHKPLAFPEALRQTLNHIEVQTNSFGRVIIMTGLLNIAYHMNQRDLQVNSLGVLQPLVDREKWRGVLTRAFDSWMKDFDTSLRRGDGPSSDPYSSSFDAAKPGIGSRVLLESGIVLHHLAHMAMHVDIVNVQIYARARWLLGRAIGTADLASVKRRMKDLWAPSPRARDATYYALKFLCVTFLPDEPSSPSHPTTHTNTNANPHERTPDEPYSTRHDLLLNRPWVIYFALLTVWCYGNALEGPCPELVVPATLGERQLKMREYLMRFSHVSSPDDLKSVTGINQNTVFLSVIRDTFNQTPWQLLQEGAVLLSNCIAINQGTMV